MVIGSLKQKEEQVRVGEVIKERKWDIYSCFFDLSQNLQQRIRATPIPYAEHYLDTLSWRFSALGEFEGRNAYKISRGKCDTDG